LHIFTHLLILDENNLSAYTKYATKPNINPLRAELTPVLLELYHYAYLIQPIIFSTVFPA
jgi:hypothetical protein